MFNINERTIDEIVQSCLNAYENLPKTGKPQEVEWTVLSCVVQYNTKNNEHKVVSLGTGSKCIGATKMSPKGNILNDSHAEIFARRGLLLYIYENMLKVADHKESIFDKEGNKFKLKDNIEFIFYSSQMPCGDASIIPKQEDKEDFGDIIMNKRKGFDYDCEVSNKKVKLDVHRTGAKCLPYAEQDSKQLGENYHIIGKVRTKPGRGDRTLSVSCSDKIARWIHIGVQGSLLDMLLSKPIILKHFIFGAGGPYSEETLKRALLLRESCVPVEERLKVMPKFYKSSIKFSHIRSPGNVRPAPASIVWANISKSSEVAVHGIKLGITKKRADSMKSSVCISKYNLFKKFHEVLQNNNEILLNICGNESLGNIPYNQMKKKSVHYQANWSKIKESFFKSWTVKPDLFDFTLNNI